jgi:plastocyanin
MNDRRNKHLGWAAAIFAAAFGFTFVISACRSELDDPVPPVLPPNGEVMTSPIPILSPTPTEIPVPTPFPTPGAELPGTGEDPAIPVVELTVTIIDSQFDPPELTVPTGATIIWNQNGALPHTITAEDGAFDSGPLSSGQTYSYIFDEPGEFPYYCSLHGGPGGVGMAGVIIVTDE